MHNGMNAWPLNGDFGRVPVRVYKTSGSGKWPIPVGVRVVNVYASGGGGGGSDTTVGVAGTATTVKYYGTTYTAAGGGAANGATPGTAGTTTSGDENFDGLVGSGEPNNAQDSTHGVGGLPGSGAYGGGAAAFRKQLIVQPGAIEIEYSIGTGGTGGGGGPATYAGKDGWVIFEY